MQRRIFLANGLATAAATAATAAMKRPDILFFDVNETLLDLAPLKKSVAAALGGREDLLDLWFTTMLQYSLVATVGKQYEAFGKIGAAAMVMVAQNHDIGLSMEEAEEAIRPVRSLPAHPDVKPALQRLKEGGFRMATLTNSSQEGVDAQMENAGLTEFFEKRLTVEGTRKFKPHADTYAWAAKKMGVEPGGCLLVAAHGWDIAGALWAGWHGAFVERPGAVLYPLAPLPEVEEADLGKIADILLRK